ncbi:MAG TPA: MFS transporter, partial [Alcanivorax sp.]|nr:MFS transporter [Alcanivorax sp.]
LADPAWNGLTWFYPVAFFVLSIAHSGVRIGRKTYLVDMAGGTKRTDYTAVSNTVIGVLLLVLGGVSAAVSLLGAQWALLLLGAMGVLGTFWSWKLKEVE